MVDAKTANKENTMNRRITLALGTMALLGVGIAIPATDVFAQQKSMKDQLAGTWTLVSWEQTNKDGTKSQRFSANPKGVNVFDANGRVFVMFARPDLPKIASNDPMNPTPEEAKAITAGSIAYFGTYTVDEPAKTVVLRVESSTLPNQIGVDQKRIINNLTADELKMTNPASVAGNVISYTFKRAK